MKERAYELMKTWCDTLLTYQVRTGTPYTNGALLCPACHAVHGRIADLCFPLTVLWDRTGDESYLERADELIEWTEYNLKSCDGVWYNDASNRWFATSAFAALAIGDAIYHFGEKLPKRYGDGWFIVFKGLSEAIYGFDKRESFRPVSNYYIGIAAALAMAWKLTSEEKYLKKAKIWRSAALERFDSEGLFYGEGYPMEAEDGSHTVDMGYNLEESIPLLLKYAKLTGELADFARARLYDHLEFLLPDGGIDDSFGTRHNKWAYWGSRTSDGLVAGLAFTLDDPMLADACDRVLSLYERCTHGGLLSMPMAHEVDEPTCLHHTFTHAKALAALVCAERIPEVKRGPLPCEVAYGIKKYQNGKLILLSNGRFRATFSACQAMLLPDFASNGGGSMNLLYHKNYGVICAATSAEYQPSEPLNQQYLRSADETPCMTAQFIVNGEQACKDKNVTIKASDTSVAATAALWRAEYVFDGDRLGITLECDNGVYNIPLVCSKKSRAVLSDDGLTLKIDDAITLTSSAKMSVDCDKRVFNQVGGLLYLPVSVEVCEKVKLFLDVK